MSHGIRKAGWALCGLVVCVTPAFGQSSPDTTTSAPDSVAHRLEAIVVTAHRYPRRVSQIANRVSVVTGEELRARGVHYVRDALRSEAGVALAESGGYGALASLFLRGGESDYVRVLVDGMPVNDPGGSFDFADLTTDNVERIEIVRGPTSVLYGSDAMTGVVQIFTRTGTDGPRVRAGVQAGTLGTIAGSGSVSGAARGLRYGAAASRFLSDGILEQNNEYANSTVSARVETDAERATRAAASLRFTSSEFHFPTDGAGRVVDRNQFQTREALTVSVEGSRELGRRATARIRAGLHTSDLGFDDAPDEPGDTLGFFLFESLQGTDRRSLDLRLDVRGGEVAVLTIGGELEEEEFSSRSRSQSEFGETEDELRASRSNRALYGQALLDPIPPLSLSAGVRWDDNERFGVIATYRTGFSYRLPHGGRVRASYGIGFKEPTFFENFAEGFVKGNPELDPERSRSWEAGLDWTLFGRRVVVATTYFRQRFRDLIQFTFAPPAEGDPNFFNVAAASADGLELEAHYRGGSGVFARVAYTSLWTRVQDAGFDQGPDAVFVEGESLLRRPRHTLAFVGGKRFRGGAVLSTAVRRVGARDDLDFAGFPATRVELPGYVSVDLSATGPLPWGLGGSVRVRPRIRIENLFDRRYEEVRNFPSRGRTILVGGDVRLGG